MTIERIRDLYQAEPFRPFVLHMADGRDVAVRHRESVALSPGGRTVVVYQPDDSMNIIDLLLVTDVEVGAANGSKRGRGKSH
jgi:hypothetical protein